MDLVLATGRLPGRGGRALHAAISGVLLGLLDDQALARLDELYYRRASMYASSEWNLRGLWDWEADAFEHLDRHGPLAVLGCGGGREVLSLLEQGYDAMGYESHPDLLRFAAGLLARRGYGGRVAPMERDTLPAGGPWSGIILGWGVLSLVASRSIRVRLLGEAAGRLTPGGRVIASAFLAGAHGSAHWLSAGSANVIRARRGLAPVELGDVLAPNRFHVFTEHELRNEFRGAGFEVIALREVADAGGPGYALVVAGRGEGAG